MAARGIYITVQDMNRLSRMLTEAVAATENDEHLLQLERELDRAKLVRSKEVPADVVTMNSKIRVRDMDTDEEKVFTLVFPDAPGGGPDQVSVLSPIGTAVLGFRVGDTIRWKAENKVMNLKVEELLYQPEAAGDYHL